MDWIERDWVEKDSKKRKIPAYLRTAGVDEEGTVFAPAAVTGNEMSAVLLANWDGVPTAIFGGHFFLPTTWLAQNWPHVERLCEKIEDNVRAAAAVQGGGSE